MTPNMQQVLGAARTVIAVLAGIAVDHGLFTAKDLAHLLDPQLWAAIGVIGALGVTAWSAWTHKQTNLVATVAALPEIARVVATNTPAGKALVKEVGTKPDAVVTVAPRPPKPASDK
jgi:Flp pilus assembly protein TadB